MGRLVGSIGSAGLGFRQGTDDMKKVLLGTTALVAAGVLAGGGVQAAEGVKLGVGGYFNSAFGYVDEDDGDGESGHNHYSTALNQDNEIHFKGQATLENGITVGARVELEGFTSGDQVDERWVYFRGGFGELRYGDEDDARKLKSYAAPTPTPNTFGVNSPYFTFNNLGPGQVASSVFDLPKPRERRGQDHLLHAQLRRLFAGRLLCARWPTGPHRLRHRQHWIRRQRNLRSRHCLVGRRRLLGRFRLVHARCRRRLQHGRRQVRDR